MPDSLSAYRAELRAIEDRWFAEHYSKPEWAGESLWIANLDLLREIDERHGVCPDDPRVYSIAAYLAERREIEAESERFARERQAIIRASGGDADPEYGASRRRIRAMLADCEARHFPGVSMRLSPPSAIEERIDTRPKLWFYVSYLVQIRRLFGRSLSPGLATPPPGHDQGLEGAYSIMHRLKIDWAPEPPYPCLTQREAHDKLASIANRLERKEMEEAVKRSVAAANARSNGESWADAILRREVASIIRDGRLTDGAWVSPALAAWVREHGRLPDGLDRGQGDLRDWVGTHLTRHDHWAEKVVGSTDPAKVKDYLIAALGKGLNEVERMTTPEKTELLQSAGPAHGDAAGSGHVDEAPSRPTDEPPKKRPFSDEEAQRLVLEYLRQHPRPRNIKEVAMGTGVSTGKVHETVGWRAYMAFKKPRSRRPERDRQLTDKMLEAMPGGDVDPAEIAAYREAAERRYLESATAEERTAFRAAEPDEQRNILWEWDRSGGAVRDD